jgi:hypothetical protein
MIAGKLQESNVYRKIINKKSILLPLKSSGQFIAKNGKYTYAVTRQFLTVAENGEIIKKEPIISYQ